MARNLKKIESVSLASRYMESMQLQKKLHNRSYLDIFQVNRVAHG